MFAAAFSYSLYLVHAPLLQVGWQTFVEPFDASREVQFGLLMAIVCPLVLGASYLFYCVAERPFEDKRRAARGSAKVARDRA